MQLANAMFQQSSLDHDPVTEFSEGLFPRLSHEEELDAYKSMESSSLYQLALFTKSPQLLDVLKTLIENIDYDTKRYARTQEVGDESIYLKIICLIDELEVRDHIDDYKHSRQRTNRKLLKHLASWNIPRHLVVGAIEEVITKPESEQLLSQSPQLKHTLKKANTDYLTQRNKLVQANLKLVFSIASRYRFLGLPYDDLVQEGSIGLLKAIERFTPEKGFKFSTYAYTAISQHIHSAIEQKASVVRKPNNQLRDKALADRTRARLEQSLARQPRSYEFAASLPDSIENKTPYVELNTHPTAYSERSHYAPADLQEHPQMGKAEQDSQTQVLSHKQIIDKALLRLDERKRKVVRMRYGIGINRVYTLKEISETLSISSERVRQISIQAVCELQELYQEDDRTSK